MKIRNLQQVTQSRPQDRLAVIRSNNSDGRVKHLSTMVASGCYRLPYRAAKMYRYDYEQSELRRVSQWARVAQWALTGSRPPGTGYRQIGVMEAAYCRVRALMMLGMSLREAIRDAQQQATPVVLYPVSGGGYCYEGQYAYTPESFSARVMPYLARGDNWAMFRALRLMGGGWPDMGVYDGCCCIVSLDSSVGLCEYGPLSVMHDRQHSIELAVMDGAKVWDAFVSGGFSAGMRAAV